MNDTPAPLTITALRALLREKQEEDVALIGALGELSQWLEAHAGKLLGDKESNSPRKIGWVVRREYGMTHLETEAYYFGRFRSPEPPGPRATLLVAHKEHNVAVPAPQELSDLNVQIDHARARIARRIALLADTAALRRIVAPLNSLNRALAAAGEALPWDIPDRYAIIDAAGLKDVRLNGGRTGI